MDMIEDYFRIGKIDFDHNVVLVAVHYSEPMYLVRSIAQSVADETRKMVTILPPRRLYLLGEECVRPRPLPKDPGYGDEMGRGRGC